MGGDLAIGNNTHLETLVGLEALKTVSNLEIFGNDQLISIFAIQHILSLNKLTISQNNSLTELTAFNNISIGTNSESRISILMNDSLTSLNGLESITNFQGNVRITDNASLTDLCALQNIVSNGNTNIVSIVFNLYNPSKNDIIEGINCSI
jgi:hypothetical protein